MMRLTSTKNMFGDVVGGADSKHHITAMSKGQWTDLPNLPIIGSLAIEGNVVANLSKSANPKQKQVTVDKF